MNKWLYRILAIILTPFVVIGVLLIMPIFLLVGFWEDLRKQLLEEINK